MKQLSPFFEPEFENLAPDLEFEARILENNSMEVGLLIKRGYKIKKPVWNGLIAS